MPEFSHRFAIYCPHNSIQSKGYWRQLPACSWAATRRWEIRPPSSSMRFGSIKCWEIGWFSCLCHKILLAAEDFLERIVQWLLFGILGCNATFILRNCLKYNPLDYQFAKQVKPLPQTGRVLLSGHTRSEPHNDLNYDRCLRGKFVCGLAEVWGSGNGRSLW